MNHKLVLDLAEQSGLLKNTEIAALNGQKAWPWHRKELYTFAELILKNQDKVQTENEPLVA